MGRRRFGGSGVSTYARSGGTQMGLSSPASTPPTGLAASAQSRELLKFLNLTPGDTGEEDATRTDGSSFAGPWLQLLISCGL
ncbi:unnamed protein product [Urochloa humidicola]